MMQFKEEFTTGHRVIVNTVTTLVVYALADENGWLTIQIDAGLYTLLVHS